ncbi:peroxiredoxin-like 2C [Papio anubis]|uniref:peroxiredoxin-like 2C n=2 Tax=Cercopithecinae TaxID=9528 RepID=UPI0012AE9131|nr:peroxiredoxin-like 2C [Papio anubis]
MYFLNSKSIHKAPAAVAELPVLDARGQRVPFGALFRERRAVVVFVRHFLCYICKEYVEDLAKIPKSFLQEANVTLIVIGQSSYHHIEPFCRLTGYSHEIYVDPEREIYKRLGMKRGEEIASSGQSPHVKSNLLSGSLQSLWRAVTGPLFDFQGDPAQQGGILILGPGDYAVLAAEPELQVGIDIMKTSFPSRGSIPEFFHIMKRKFTNKEWETIRSFKDEWTQLDMFYRNWALKESFIKAIGVGLGFELQRLEFDLSPLNLDIGQVYKETRLFLDGEEEKEWAFEESKIDEHHFVAVALRKPDGSRHQDVPSQDDSKPTQRQFTILNFNDLISSAVPMTPEDPSFWDCFCFTEEIPIRNGTKS